MGTHMKSRTNPEIQCHDPKTPADGNEPPPGKAAFEKVAKPPRIPTILLKGTEFAWGPSTSPADRRHNCGGVRAMGRAFISPQLLRAHIQP